MVTYNEHMPLRAKNSVPKAFSKLSVCSMLVHRTTSVQPNANTLWAHLYEALDRNCLVKEVPRYAYASFGWNPILLPGRDMLLSPRHMKSATWWSQIAPLVL